MKCHHLSAGREDSESARACGAERVTFAHRNGQGDRPRLRVLGWRRRGERWNCMDALNAHEKACILHCLLLHDHARLWHFECLFSSTRSTLSFVPTQHPSLNTIRVPTQKGHLWTLCRWKKNGSSCERWAGSKTAVPTQCERKAKRTRSPRKTQRSRNATKRKRKRRKNGLEAAIAVAAVTLKLTPTRSAESALKWPVIFDVRCSDYLRAYHLASCIAFA